MIQNWPSESLLSVWSVVVDPLCDWASDTDMELINDDLLELPAALLCCGTKGDVPFWKNHINKIKEKYRK